MRRSFCFSVLVCFSMFSVAADMSLYLMDGEDFYHASPRQTSLAEQFSATVKAAPLPIRFNQAHPVRIAILLFGEKDAVENQALLFTFKRRMRELGIDYRLDTYADSSVRKDDVTLYFKMVSAEPDYIVMTKFGFMQRRFIERFLASGKSKVILYDFASPLTHWVNDPPLIYIGVDQKLATKRLVDYLDRHLPKTSQISAIVSADSYMEQVRCNLFLDEIASHGRKVRSIKVIPDSRAYAFQSANMLLNEGKTDFIFSCSQEISEGVVSALQQKGISRVKTNAWKPWFHPSEDVKQAIKASVLFHKDDLSIAVAEAIKLDLEGQNIPLLYMSGFDVVGTQDGAHNMQLMVEKMYPYSVTLWQK